MNTFGNTNQGYEEPIKEYVRCDYKEPDINDPIQYERNAVSTPEKPLEIPAGIDCYLVSCDGYSHDSYERLLHQRIHHLRKRVGPLDMYRRPICTSMDLDWHKNDPFLKGKRGDWLKNYQNYPSNSTDVSRFVDGAITRDRRFFL